MRYTVIKKGAMDMQYFISFLEGIITFISPCLLPMLPIYISYFAGGGERSTKKTMTGAPAVMRSAPESSFKLTPTVVSEGPY